ncbi:MAG: type 1 glutamine amidotransferase domain-containing protein [Phycisphaerae bacterium]
MSARLLDGKNVLAFVGDDYEDLELWYPKLRLEEAGARVVMAGEQAGHAYRGKHGYPARSDVAVDSLAAGDFDALLVGGGWMPDKLRRNAKVLQITREMFIAGKLVATICHGPWILISAGICRGVCMTSTPGIRDDVVNAGADWVDAPVVVYKNLISSRRPADLPEFGAAMVAFLSRSA